MRVMRVVYLWGKSEQNSIMVPYCERLIYKEAWDFWEKGGGSRFSLKNGGQFI